ncbi:MAG: SDR family NAD(P)-dependent oxidoreductase [Actinobacteria bacterium]|nr:SDR family NAD(P)-dependent oxidoreductase [Actinomycetota bacterium]MBO0815358.1 SDR family NAD(P)-dependent oxidoreductase [Actinomycetota bacterium]
MSTCTRSHIVVTGASSGIGRATALRLAATGAHVYAGVRRLADAPAAPAGPALITPLLLDVTDPAQIGAAAATVAGHTGGAGLDGLVNNAGIGLFGPLEIIPIAEFRRQLEVNVTGQLAVTQAMLPQLRLGRGRIVLIGSIGTRFTPPFTGPVSASKSTIATMADAFRQELAPWGIRVILVEPASIHTEAVGKADRDAGRLLREAGPDARELYEGAFRRMLRAGLSREENGSPPDAVARVVAHALAARSPRARYLAGKDARPMAALGAVLPVAVADALRRKITRQPAPGSLTRSS